MHFVGKTRGDPDDNLRNNNKKKKTKKKTGFDKPDPQNVKLT